LNAGLNILDKIFFQSINMMLHSAFRSYKTAAGTATAAIQQLRPDVFLLIAVDLATDAVYSVKQA